MKKPIYLILLASSLFFTACGNSPKKIQKAAPVSTRWTEMQAKAWAEPRPDGSEPPLWFHEIFRKDGTPYKQEEVDLIRQLTNKK